MPLTNSFKTKFFIAGVFFVMYYIIFGATSFLSGYIHTRFSLALPFEHEIPFYPAWSIIYLSINFYLLFALVVFSNWQQLAAFGMTLLLETTIAGVCFLVFAIKIDVCACRGPDSHFTMIVFVAKFLSMNDNYFPSLHTAFAFTGAFAYSQYCSKWVKMGFYIWACSIPLATLFIHEHHIVDLIGGFTLAWASNKYVLPVLTQRLMDWSDKVASEVAILP